MYLRRLVLHGFKSFADRTVVELERGVTGVVGPNGCGKSNIADAIKWVLGEQSPKSLRASSMQDVLFEGADTRSAMSFCEVFLTFSDCEAQLGTEFNEVEVGRRVEREGGSDYYINGKACRLKDIQNLFRDTGIGRVAYSFLQQGQIDRLLSSNPLERRAVFEEAAGISGFKVKREETLRKLTEVEGNLARVSDILAEVSSQMGSLKRQAARAVRAQRLRKQLSALERALMAYDLGELEQQLAAYRLQLPPLEQQEHERQTELEAAQQSLRALQGELGNMAAQQQQQASHIFETRSQREEALSHERFLTLRAQEAHSRAQALAGNIDSLRQQLDELSAEQQNVSAQVAEATSHALACSQAAAAAQERHATAEHDYEAALSDEQETRGSSTAQEGALTSLRTRLSALELEAHGLQAQLGPLGAQQETLQAERDRAAADRLSAENELVVAREQVSAAHGAQQQAVATLQQLRQQIGQARESFESCQRTHAQQQVERDLLMELNRRYEGFGQATRELLSSGEYTPLVAGLQVAPEGQRAIEALLALELEAVMPLTPIPAPLMTLTQGERVALPQLVAAPVATAEGFPAGLQPAAYFITAAPALDYLRARLEGCYICQDATHFEALLQSPPSFEFVAIASSSGAMIDGRGLFTAPAAPASSATFLSRSQRLQELAGQLELSQDKLQQAKAHMTTLDHALTDAQAQLEREQSRLASAQAYVSAAQSAGERAQAALQRAQLQLEKLTGQTSAAHTRLQSIAQQRAQLQTSYDTSLQEKIASDERLQALAEVLSTTRSARDEAYSALSHARLADANARHARQGLEQTAQSLQARSHEAQVRLTQSQAERERLETDAADYRSQAHSHAQRAQQLHEQLQLQEQQLEQLTLQLRQQEGEQSQALSQIDNLRQRLSSVSSELLRVRLELGQVQTRQQMLMEEAARRFDAAVDIAALDWRVLLAQAELYARADESTLEMAEPPLPSAEVLAERFPLLDRSQLTTDAQSLRQKLDGIGPINESALEDYRAHEERYNTLKTQSDDLLAAKTELAGALMELSSQSSSLFNETFERIRTNFRGTFEALFGGGKADLVLSTPEDPLNSGIEILARPPGTQLKQLGLLSGGQKTMTAVALLFAIYQVKPSPFCVLDELDAPLDDANIGRFLAMLKRFTSFSQFVIITHNKRTMAACDLLYGVTMQERGVSRLLSMRLTQAESYSKPAPVEDIPSQVPAEDVAANVAGYSLDALGAPPAAPEPAPADSAEENELKKILSALNKETDAAPAAH
jgi:chromosome segregation protein